MQQGHSVCNIAAMLTAQQRCPRHNCSGALLRTEDPAVFLRILSPQIATTALNANVISKTRAQIFCSASRPHRYRLSNTIASPLIL